MIYLVVKEGLKGIRKLFNLKACFVFLIIAVPWYIAQILINGDEFIQAFFIKHHLMRYTGVISGHRGPIYYFIPALIIGMFPWIAFLPAGIRNVFKDSNKLIVTSNKLKEKDSSLVTRHSSLNLLAFIWFAFIFIFFSFSITKLPNYILPAIPAASILISSGMSVNDKWRKYANIFIAVISLFLGMGFLISKRYFFRFGITTVR